MQTFHLSLSHFISQINFFCYEEHLKHMEMGYSNNRFLGLFLFFISMSILFSSPATACTFFQLDWVPNPSQHYTHWAQRNRFQVNDTLCKSNLLLFSNLKHYTNYVYNVVQFSYIHNTSSNFVFLVVTCSV